MKWQCDCCRGLFKRHERQQVIVKDRPASGFILMVCSSCWMRLGDTQGDFDVGNFGLMIVSAETALGVHDSILGDRLPSGPIVAMLKARAGGDGP